MWFTEELETTNLGDKRLNERFAQILEALGNSPSASIPAALGGRAELEAAYRFFDNDKVTPEKLLASHFKATIKRCREQKVVLVAQDTSEMEFTRPEQQVVGAGPLADTSRLGAFLHPHEVFTVDGTPLGAVDAKLWAREMPDPEEPKLSFRSQAGVFFWLRFGVFCGVSFYPGGMHCHCQYAHLHPTHLTPLATLR